MADIASIIGLIGGVIAIPIAVISLLNQRRQTQLMAQQVDREIEVKLTRDLAPESVIDSTLRTFLNKRLGDNRALLRQEFGSRLDKIERILEESHIPERGDIAEDALRLLSYQTGAVEDFKESSTRVSELEHEIRTLQQTIEDIRNGVGNQAMVRAQIRGIAEQLLRMTGQEERAPDFARYQEEPDRFPAAQPAPPETRIDDSWPAPNS
jgi:hypothetical protein